MSGLIAIILSAFRTVKISILYSNFSKIFPILPVSFGSSPLCLIICDDNTTGIFKILPAITAGRPE